MMALRAASPLPHWPGVEVEPPVTVLPALENFPEVNLAPQEVTFGDPRGGRRPSAPLAIEVLRELEPGDLQALSGAVAAPAQRLLQIRQPHHALARLICEGRELAEVALITGYAPSYISNLQNDPAFAELLSYYSVQREQVFVDVLERMRTLGLHSMEELQRRLEEAPEKFSNREVMELVDRMVIAPADIAAKAKGTAGPSGGSTSIQISFVGAGPGPIDVTPRRDS